MEKSNKIEKLVPDTSVIIEGLVSDKIQKKEIKPDVILIHEAVIAELEHQANLNKAVGFIGLDELKKLKDISSEFGFKIEFAGKKPSAAEIKYAKLGEIDAMIRDMAYEEDATLFTADKVQARIAETKNIKFIFIEVEKLVKKIMLEDFFDKETMSVHLREGVLPHAKKGVPGKWEFVAIRKKKIAHEEIKDISREIIETSGMRKDGFIEIERPGSTIVQLGSYRIVITKPPFSDGWEITAVRPVRKLGLEDYKLSEKLKLRIEKAEGILIAGAPGMGKSTMAQALAEHYAAQNKIVKTIEAPRDLVLPDDITQYAISHGDAQEIHDILLLTRPDNTIFDEMRNTKDFQLYADLRLSGVGMAGVVHATSPIDAIQRFVGRIELGVIPQVIDTVIFIKNGAIGRVLSLKMTVKVPSGMVEADLARPVVVVTDFETGKLEYELYSYGEETVVIPVAGKEKSPANALAERAIEDEFRNYTDNVRVDVVSANKAVVYVPSADISRVIGKQGRTIEEIEKRLGISIDVQELGGRAANTKDSDNTGESDKTKRESPFEAVITKKAVILDCKGLKNTDVGIYINNELILSAKTGNEGTVKINKKSRAGQILASAISRRENIRVVS